jgi:AcrR family transcriptional regulator
MARRTRAETADANRRAVLDAARQQFEQHGYHGASLDGIAEAADFSKGAVYSRFTSKDDLFLAVLEDHIARRAEATAAQLDELDDRVGVEVLARLAIEASVSTVAWQAALLEFRAHAWRHPDVNARYGQLHRRTVDSIASFMDEVYRRRGERPPIPTREMAVAGLANGTGVVAEYMADPDLDVPALIEATVPVLAIRHLRAAVEGEPIP